MELWWGLWGNDYFSEDITLNSIILQIRFFIFMEIDEGWGWWRWQEIPEN